MPAAQTDIPVKFIFLSANPETKKRDRTSYGVFKAVGGKKSRYLCGIASGTGIDHHKDQLTPECIQGFIQQAKSEDILLYVNHDREMTRDVGILSSWEIIRNDDGTEDWYTEWRLFDESDKGSVPTADIQEANKLWAQAMGLPPYQTQRKFGFSIEGLIPVDAVRQEGEIRKISYIKLSPGVTVVPEPAYPPSRVEAISKAFKRKVKKDILGEMIAEEQAENNYWEQKTTIQRAFDELVDSLLKKDISDEEKQQSLNEYFDSLKEKMIPVLLTRPSEPTDSSPPATTQKSSKIAIARKATAIFKALLANKEIKMDEDLKKLISDAIASLQMVLQSGDNDEETMTAAKSVLGKLASVVAKADGGADNMPDDKKEPTEAEKEALANDKDQIVKGLAAIKAKLAKKGAGEIPAEEKGGETQPIEKAEDEEVEKALALLQKAMEANPTDGAGNANGTVEEMIEEVLPESVDEEVDVKKAIALFAKKLKARKSAGAYAPLAKKLEALTTLVQKSVQSQQLTEKAIGQMIQGFGVVENKAPQVAYDQASLNERVLKQLNAAKENPPAPGVNASASPFFAVSKELGEAYLALHGSQK